jgi:transposase
MTIPNWAIEQKEKGTEIKKIGNYYYLYEIKSKWDKKKKRSKKVSGKYLGKITPEGLIKPKKEQIEEGLKNISVKEFGATDLILKMNSEIERSLKEIFPDKWKEIYLFGIFRLCYNSPINTLSTYYHDSYISNQIENARMSSKFIGDMLGELGKERELIRIFLRQFLKGEEFAIIDLTHVLSLSEGVISAVTGYNSKKEFLPQIHMIFLFSLDEHIPSYFRIVPGSIRDVTSLINTVREAEVNNTVLITDKGFFSEDNVLKLDDENMHYIMPLKRNSTLIDYSNLRKTDKSGFAGYFLFENRAIWYYNYEISDGNLKGKNLYVFLDIKLKAEEEKDYLSRIGNDDKYSFESFMNIQHRQGTISVISDLDLPGERIYYLLKSRIEIEQMFDVFKNTLHADRSFMRDDYHMEGWMFINFIALLFYYKIYNLLSKKELLKKHSPKNVLLELSRIRKLKILDNWHTSEVPKKARVILEKLELPIP